MQKYFFRSPLGYFDFISVLSTCPPGFVCPSTRLQVRRVSAAHEW